MISYALSRCLMILIFDSLQVFIRGQVWACVRHWTPTPGLALLQASVSQHSSMCTSHRLHHPFPHIKLLKDPVSWSRQMWYNRQWSPPPRSTVSSTPEVVGPGMWIGRGPGSACGVTRVSGTFDAQHHGVWCHFANCKYCFERTETLLLRVILSYDKLNI